MVKMGRSIRWRLALPYIILVTATMVGLSLYLVSYVRTTYTDNLRNRMLADARILAVVTEPVISGQVRDSSAVQQLAVKYGAMLNTRITIIDPQGKVLGESQADPDTMENHLTRPEVQAALKGESGNETRFSATLREQMLYVAVPIGAPPQIYGVARLAVPLAEVEADLNRIRQTIFLVTLIAIILTVLLSILITSYTVRPLDRLTIASRQMASGSFAEPVLIDTQDEIGELTQAFNYMAARLREQIGELQSEQSKLEAVLANMTDGVLIADSDGNVQLINPAAARLFNLGDHPGVGRSLIEVVRHHQLVELWKKCLETGELQSATLEVSAERLFLQSVATSLGPAMPGSTLLFFQDLTRLRRLETVRQDFISNVSHELRTPLASLKALTETLQEGALEDPPAARRFLSRMDTEIDTLTQMVRELLELSRIESGRVPLQRKPILPNALVSPAVERMRLQAERAGLQLRIECPADLPEVSADQERMDQVLVNLVHNAIKFTPPGGEVVVSAYAETKDIVFFVRDTGVGIAEKDLSRIFERFYKADRARSGGGTGLGLSIARHIIEAHNGRIWAESQQGKGSTFYFSIPLAK
jgi:two-component system, OmpR family, phosphate regulon sensor histidine kinase PhoR